MADADILDIHEQDDEFVGDEEGDSKYIVFTLWFQL